MFPSDMPDLKSSTNHLAPLNLPAQLSLYYPGREGRLGIQVRGLHTLITTRQTSFIKQLLNSVRAGLSRNANHSRRTTSSPKLASDQYPNPMGQARHGHPAR